MASSTASYWCYSCTRFVAVLIDHTPGTSVACPHCHAGFIEQVEADPSLLLDNPHPRINPTNPSSDGPDRSDRIPNLRFRRTRRSSAERSPFNPVIVLRGNTLATPPAEDAIDEGATNAYEFFYDDGTGSGLRPVPATISEFLMGSGFDRLLDQLAQIEVNGLGRSGNPPASKAVVESMPTLDIAEAHVVAEEHCAVCKEAFELGNEAREMPCKHIYHTDCILPWLAVRNSCPVCRHELPVDREESEIDSVGNNEDEIVGLTIWRLPGGGFAVGRFTGGRRGGGGGGGGDREYQGGVFTEVDGGGFGGSGAAPRRVLWRSRRESGVSNGGNGGSGLGRVLRGFGSFFRRFRSNSVSGNGTASFTRSSSFSSFVRRRRRGLDLEVENGTPDRW